MARASLTAMDAVLRIRKAQLEAARAAMSQASSAVLRARDVEANRRTARDDAEQTWREALTGRLPDPMLVRGAGDWLVGSERDVAAASLDTTIAERGLDASSANRSMAQARLDASREVRSNLERTIARRREAEELVEASDAFLRRWRR